MHRIHKGISRNYLLITLLSMLILISGMPSIQASTLLVLLSLPMLKRPVSLIPMLFVTSWNMSFGIFGIGAYFYYFSLFFIAMFFNHRQYGRYVGPNFTTLLCLLFGAYIVFSTFYSISRQIAPSVRQMFTIFSVAYVGLYQCRERNYVYSCLFWIAVAASFYFGLRMLMSPIAYVTIDADTGFINTSPRPTIMSGVNPNTAAQIIAVLSIILFIAVMRLRKFKDGIILALLFNLNTLIQLGSRTSFYALAICFVFYLFFATHISKGRKFFLMLLTAVGMYVLLQFIDMMENRLFYTTILEDEGSGRFVSWTRLWEEVVPKYWLRGFGFGRENYSILGYHFDADNLYLDLLCQLGVIGSTIFYVLHFRMMRRVSAARKRSVGMEMMFFMLLSYLISGLGESVFDFPLYWATLILAGTLYPTPNPHHPSPNPHHPSPNTRL